MKEYFMQRCFELAALGNQYVAPNPAVGALIVHNNRIIGEGYHKAYGSAHAEVNAVASVSQEDRSLLPYSTIYVSLEPCSIYGNTPPCTSLILKEKIPRVVISYIDHTPGVDGEGISILRKQGVEVEVGVLEEKGRRHNAPRNNFILRNRPHIILKFAQSANGIFAPLESRQLWLTNPLSKRLVHRWRSESKAILVGKKTVLADNPQLTNRCYYGPDPIRVIIDSKSKITSDHSVLDGNTPTLVFTKNKKSTSAKNLEYLCCPEDNEMLPFLLHTLKERKISKLLVEGGIHTLEQFIEKGWWDEARVFISSRYISEGRFAPVLPTEPSESCVIDTDTLLRFSNPYSQSLNFH